MTNREWLESLSDDELAEWLTRLHCHQICPELFCKAFCRFVGSEDCCTKTDQFGNIACEYNMEDILFLWLQAK